MDELLCMIRHDYGLKINDTQVAAMTYADEIIVLESHVRHTQFNLDIITNFLKERGLSININKCTALSTGRVPRKKNSSVLHNLS